MANKEEMLEDEILNDEEIEEISDEDDDLEEGHDPVNAEKKSVDSVDKAAHTGPRAKKRHADKSNSMKRDKVNKGFVRELYDMMNEMSQEELRKLHALMTNEDFDINEESEDALEDVEYDFNEDLTDLVESEATLSEGFKEKASVIMETAIKSKMREEVARLEESYDEKIEEELESIVEKVDSYLSYVVENWMEENKLAVENGLRTEIAEGFMNSLKDLFVESYIEVPEEKVDLVDELAEQVEELETELNAKMETDMALREELEGFKRERVLYKLGEDLTDTQLEKLMTLSEDVDFDDEESFANKVGIIKETHFTKKKTTEIHEDLEDEEEIVELDETMGRYVNVLQRSNR